RQHFDEITDPSFGAKHLPLVRAEMAKQGLDGLLVPHEDEHQNEYLPDANERLAWVTGFTGSAGAGVVFADSAAVFVDGRYTVQVKAQTDDALFSRVPLNVQNKWLSENVKAGQVIGYDPRLHSPDALDAIRAAVE
ncbi:aminopeptidase P family N-terminal domain-containing protein, partial [Klebsiella michiganensis]|uniref:aminopeptidase P family N-terminal domain-containing protein n=1 Tax=Klebsiella michiganensis TaxID=1134687 RepID=UPI0034D62D8A